MTSVVVCTNRESFLPNILYNFQRQSLKEKELILIVNSMRVNLEEIYKKLPRNKIKFQLRQFPEEMSLGNCLNKGVDIASSKYIAKMDDDDFYGSQFLLEARETLDHTKADIVGKSSFYVYFKRDQELRLYNPNHENRWILNNGNDQYRSSYFFSGATLVFKKDIFKSVSFPDLNRGEDSGFQRECFQQGMKMYSLSKEHYVYMRYNQPTHHHSDVNDFLLKRRSIYADIPSIMPGFYDWENN
ncbi:glycosyltransferase family 2 protein [Bacillus sp. EB01]|uniref:glycosyltransferase family 2 protein n=1 Tax=Bacillus sp. EB01 TaxID=1347086 RepID=UPI0005C4D88F|nr:glycosyltransferase family 2 protein [Bacillus sp. EB01]